MSPWKWKLCCQQADFHGFQERTERWAGFPIWLFHQLWLVLETFTTSLSERFLHSLVTPARLSSRILPQVHLLKPQKVISKLIYFRLHSTSNLTTWFFWTFIIHAVVLANICVTVGWATFLLGCLLSTFSPPFTVCFQEAFLYTKSRVKFQSRFLFWLSFDILSSHFWEWNYVLLWHMTCCAWRISRCLTGWLSCTVDISLWMLQMIALHCSTLSCQRHF